MKRVINITNIKDTSKDINTLLLELNVRINELKKDINKINSCYKGIDAKILVDKYTMYANKLSDMATNFENFAIYTGNISGAYDETYEKTKKDMNSCLEELNTTNLVNSNVFYNEGDRV